MRTCPKWWQLGPAQATTLGPGTLESIPVGALDRTGPWALSQRGPWLLCGLRQTPALSVPQFPYLQHKEGQGSSKRPTQPCAGVGSEGSWRGRKEADLWAGELTWAEQGLGQGGEGATRSPGILGLGTSCPREAPVRLPVLKALFSAPEQA